MTIDLEGLEVVAEGFAFTECPRWHRGWLYFSDMYGRAIFRVTEAGVVEEVVREEARPGGFGFTADGDLLYAAMDAARVMRLRDGVVGLHVDLSSIAPGGINDMVVDAEGRCYIAHFSHDLPPPSKPVIFLDAQGGCHQSDDLLKVANGMILTTDGGHLIVAESAGGRISRMTLGEDGTPEHRTTFAELPPGHFADGICGDAAGGVWVACCRGPGVIRVEEGGAITHRVLLGEGRFAYACALGGEDGRTLFVCTAGPYEPSRMAQSRDARIEAIRAPFEGRGIP